MIEVISYEINKGNLTVGFKLNDFVVYSSLAYDESKSKEELLQLAYEQCKSSIDYELTQEEHSITTDLEGEEFIPTHPHVKELNLYLPKSISFPKHFTLEEIQEMFEDVEGSEEITVETIYNNQDVRRIPIKFNAIDQYGDGIEVEPLFSTSYGKIEDGMLVISRVETYRGVEVSGIVDEISTSHIIGVYPYIEPQPSKIELMEGEITELRKTIDALIGGENNG